MGKICEIKFLILVPLGQRTNVKLTRPSLENPIGNMQTLQNPDYDYLHLYKLFAVIDVNIIERLVKKIINAGITNLRIFQNRHRITETQKHSETRVSPRYEYVNYIFTRAS